MKRYLIQRFAYAVITLFIIVTATFLLMQLLPGTPYSNAEKLTESQRAILDAKYGLDKPVAIQYITYIGNLIQGDLGYSFQYQGRTVMSMIGDRIGPSALIGLQGLVFGTIIGLVLGIISALRHNTAVDYVSVTIAVLGMSIPSFVFAALLQYFIGVKLGWLPVALWENYQST
ncbi:MAG: ABC transporter permease, partial [Bhargavaea sp.]